MRNSHLEARLLISLLPCSSVSLLNAGKADALLVFNFDQQGPDVVLSASGSLSGLPPVLSSGVGTSANGIRPTLGEILLGKNVDTPYNRYAISGPTDFGTGALQLLSLVSSSNNHIGLQGSSLFFGIDPTYVEGSPITYSGKFANTMLASLGLSSTSGLLAEYTIGADAIKVYAGPVPVPTPAPWLAGTLAFGFSRRLRSRIRGSKAPAQP